MIGFLLLILGVLVTARDVWLGVWYWPAFGADERIRFVFWLWAGAVLLMAGCWLGFRLKGSGWALIIVIASLVGIVYSHGRWWS